MNTENLTDERPVPDAKAPTPLKCVCAEDKTCWRCYRVCPCSNAFGDCSRTCYRCFGDGFVPLVEAHEDTCSHCEARATDLGGVPYVG